MNALVHTPGSVVAGRWSIRAIALLRALAIAPTSATARVQRQVLGARALFAIR
jgi:hypothetical protein